MVPKLPFTSCSAFFLFVFFGRGLVKLLVSGFVLPDTPPPRRATFSPVKSVPAGDKCCVVCMLEEIGS